MDKRTIGVVIACMLALFGWQLLVSKLYPPIKKQPASTNLVAGATADTNAPAAVSGVATSVTTRLEPVPAPVEPPVSRPDEKRETLSNQFVRLEFTSWGGGVRKAELLHHQADDGGHVVLETEAAYPALTVTGLGGTEGAFEFTAVTATSIVMEAKVAGGVLTKRFELNGDYLLTGTIEYSKPVTQAVQIAIGQMAPLHPDETRDMVGVDWLGRKYETRHLDALWSNNAKKIYMEPASAPWGAVKNQFFTMVLTPATNAVAVHYMPHRLAHPASWPAKTERDAVAASLEVLPRQSQAGAVWPVTLYVGPKEYDRLKALGRGQAEVMDFGIFGIISILFLKSMNFFHGLIPNYGVAIILVTILIKLVFWPVQAKAIHSMKEMQKFQPLMAKLKEKYKDDAQRMNQEMMKLYKEHKINPFSGCLPMLVQIPVFMGLFYMLRSAIELRGQNFLWVGDLSRPDTIFHLFGLPVNPLPLLMTGSMIWQQKLTPTTGDAQQQKMMMFMPLLMLIFFYNASSGLALYWTVQQFLSIAQQWWSLRQPDKPQSTPAKAK
jgi:YidC/Oxa1 family membrane protein insertase